MGAIEIEYEGSEDFLKQELPELLKAVSDLYKSAGAVVQNPTNLEKSSTDANLSKPNLTEGTTATLAAKLGGETGPDLAMTAAAQLHFVQKKEKFTRKELSTEMRSASAYFKESYASNLAKTVETLVKTGKLTEPSKDKFSLSANSIKSLGDKLA